MKPKYYTPLRYPGGKQKLAPFIAEIIRKNSLEGCDYVEPYAGGAGVALKLLFDGVADRLHLNDACGAIFAFWNCVLDDSENLCRRISRAWLDVQEWKRQREILSRISEFSPTEVGFAAFYLNRVNRSGILTGGLIGGLEQKGEWLMDARFPRQELIRRIQAIAKKRERITLSGIDAEEYIRKYLPELPESSLVYLDPPYYDKADRLYLNHYKPDDHSRLAKTVQKIKLPWIVSYDSVPQIAASYVKRRSIVYDLQYNAGSAYVGKELFIFSDKLEIPDRSVLKSVDIALKSARAPK